MVKLNKVIEHITEHFINTSNKVIFFFWRTW